MDAGEQLGSCSKVVALQMKRNEPTLMRYIGNGNDGRYDERVKRRGLPG